MLNAGSDVGSAAAWPAARDGDGGTPGEEWAVVFGICNVSPPSAAAPLCGRLAGASIFSNVGINAAVADFLVGGLVGSTTLAPNSNSHEEGRAAFAVLWVALRRTPPAARRIAVLVYGFPPNVGAVGTAALLNVPKVKPRMHV